MKAKYHHQNTQPRKKKNRSVNINTILVLNSKHPSSDEPAKLTPSHIITQPRHTVSQHRPKQFVASDFIITNKTFLSHTNSRKTIATSTARQLFGRCAPTIIR